MKKLALAAGMAGLAISLSCGTANATVLDFVALANSGEKAVLGDFSLGGFTVTAHGSNAVGGNVPAGFDASFTNPYAYLDKGGGMGVCQNITATLQCTPSSDDNVTGANLGVIEILSTSFNQAVKVTNLIFKADGHTFLFDATDAIDISVDGLTWVTYFLLADGSGMLSGNPLFALAANEFLHFKFNNEQFYLAAAEVNAIPVPPAIMLMGTALLGMGLLGRRRKRQAAA